MRLAILLAVVITAPELTNPAVSSEVPQVLVDSRRVTITWKSFTVADALTAAGVELKPGPVYSAATRTLLGNDGPIPDLMLDGGRADPDAILYSGARLQIETVETIEGVVARAGPSAATLEGLPDVEPTLFHPGHGAVVEQKVGERSGEVVSESITTQAVPAEPVGEKLVALTFDDGPDPTWTPKVLEILKSEGVVGTFCLVGHMVARSKALANEIVAQGHMVCNHTANHALLGRASADRVFQELNGGADTLKAVTGVEAAFYRPPGGELSPTVVAAAHQRGQRVLHWSLDTADYRRPDAAVLVDRVMRNVGPGSVVLMHDGGGDRSQTVSALRPIIQVLKAEGYGFTTPAAVTPVSRAV